MLSAHGSAPEVVAAARDRGGYVVDAVCPLVTKVHHEVKTRAKKGYQIVYIGHEGHEEAVGTMAVAPDVIHRVESREEVDALPEDALARITAKNGLFFERIAKKTARKAAKRGKQNVEPRTVDLAPGIHAAKWRDALPRDAEGWITAHDDERILELRLTLQGPDMVRPEGVLWLLFEGRIPPQAQVIRRRLLPAQERVGAGRAGV